MPPALSLSRLQCLTRIVARYAALQLGVVVSQDVDMIGIPCFTVLYRDLRSFLQFPSIYVIWSRLECTVPGPDTRRAAVVVVVV